MIMKSALFVASILSITNAEISLDCQYFEGYNPYSADQNALGPAIPCNVCFAVEDPEASGSWSYEFTCFSGNQVMATSYNNKKCSGLGYGALSFYAYASTSGGVCDHITFKVFEATSNGTKHGETCEKQQSTGYFELAFVNGCYDSLKERGRVRSTELSCTDTSFDVKRYSDTGCNGVEFNANSSTIEPGCHHLAFPKIHTLFPNISIPGGNYTYLEISECGSKNFPLWIIIVIAVAGCLCCCGCCAVVVWLFCRRRKGINTGYVQTYGE
mmetsp:Transcript_839/g.1224  ORF Transcript_839/g.1224 Transcript_839/m.1224 type:complete len:270 (-) Transcript_839:104-913(-)